MATEELTVEDRQRAESLVANGHFASVSDALHAGLEKLSAEASLRALVKGKVLKSLDDFAAGRVVSREEFLTEVDHRRRKRA